MQNLSVARLLLLLGPSIILRAFAMDILIPCFPSITAEFASPVASAQLIFTAYLLTSGVGQLVIGPLADYFGRKKVILASLLLFIFGSLACSYADSLAMLIVTRMLQGLGACGASVVTFTIVRDLFNDQTTPRIYSYVNGIISLAPILAPTVGGTLLVQSGTWRTNFFVMAMFASLIVVVNLIWLRETNPRAQAGNNLGKFNYAAAYKEVFSNRSFLTYNFCAIAGLTCLFTFFSMSSLLLINTLNIPADKFGFYFSATFLLYLGGNLISTFLQKVLGPNNVIKLGLYSLFSGGLLMLGMHLQGGLTLVGLLLPNTFLTFGFGLIFGPCLAGAMRQFKHIAGTASAAFGCVLYCSSSMLANLVLSFQKGNTLPLAIAAIALGTTALLLFSRTSQALVRDPNSETVSYSSS